MVGTTKVCTRCHRELPAMNDYFCKARRSGDGLNCWCRNCRKVYEKEERPREVRYCLWCGIDFKCFTSSRKKFCSLSCATKYRWENDKRLIFEVRKGISAKLNKKVKLICDACGREFLAHAYRSNKAKYCSTKCYGLDHRGENGPGWKGGTQFDPYPIVFNDQLKGGVRVRHDYTCQICKKSLNGQCMDMCVHHINYDKSNCSDNNLVLLCRSCHGATGINRSFWTGFFKYMFC